MTVEATVGVDARQEFTRLIESGELPSALLYRAVAYQHTSEDERAKTLEEFMRFANDAWGVLRDGNWGLFTFEGSTRQFGDNTFNGRLNSITAHATLSMRNTRDTEDGNEERTLAIFESDWLKNLKTLEKLTVIRVVKSKQDGKTVKRISSSLDFKTGIFEIS